MLPGSLAALEIAQLGPAAFHFSPLSSWSLARKGTRVDRCRGLGVSKAAPASGSKSSNIVRVCKLFSETFSLTRKPEPNPRPCFTAIS